MNNSFTLYEHINRVNGKRYVGITERRPEDRWGVGGNNYTTSPRFWNAIKKYGWDAFDHVIVATNLSKEQACDMEVERIKLFNAIGHGYNSNTGGNHPTMTEEARAKLSRSMMGNKNGLGKPCSPEKAKKIGDAQRGRHFDEEHRRHISEAKTGKPHAPPTEETRKKISDSHSKQPVCCEETETIYESVHACAKRLGLDASRVSATCRGKTSHAKGYHLTYLPEFVLKA